LIIQLSLILKNSDLLKSGFTPTSIHMIPGTMSVPLLFACEEQKMGKPKYSETTAVAAFVAGAALAAGVTLLLSPKTGRQIRENIGDIKEEAVEKLKVCAREAKFKLSPKTKPDAFVYEGGDCWI
jgi:hypothetical protein